MADIKSLKAQGRFEDVVAEATPEIREIAVKLRSLVADVMPGVTEVSWKKLRISSYGVGPKKMSEHFCYIAPLTKYVNFGFYYGAEMNNPGCLEGTGRLLRHVKVRSLKEAKDPGLKKLVKQASAYLPRRK